MAAVSWQRLAIGLVALGGCRPGPVDVASLAPPNQLATDLVAHWSFDDGAGTVVHDQSGNGRDGTLTGGTWIAGKFGGALHFGGQDLVTVPSFPAATASWSLSLWSYIATAELPPLPPPQPGPPPPNVLEVFASTQNQTGGWEINAAFGPTVRRYHFGYVAGGLNIPFADCDCLILDRWEHVAVVFDATTSTIDIYQNGALATTTPMTGTVLPGDTTLYFGRWAILNNPLFLTGAIDDVAVYRRALVPEEVANLAQAPAPDPH
jgi:hypothetical protein